MPSTLPLRRWSLAALLAIAGCDLPTDPAPLNPYDPAYGGPRTATAPTELRIAASSLAEITLAWTDNSTFESGVRVERAPAFGDPRFLNFETVAVLAPDATTYTDAALDSDAPVAYRVTALVEEGRDSQPSDVLALRYQTDRVPVDPLADAFGDASASPDGATVYVQAYQRTLSVIDAATGALVARFADTAGVAGFLADGRVALYREPSDGVVFVDLTRGAVRERSVALLTPAPCYFVSRVVVSADGTRAAAACRGNGRLAVWRLAAPNAPTFFGLAQGSTGSTESLAGLSPDGRTVVGGTSVETVAFDTETRSARWRVPVDVAGARLSPDGRYVLLSGGVNRINVRDAATGSVLAGAAGSPFGFQFSGDGATVAYSVTDAGGYTSVVQVARAADLTPVARLSKAELRRTTPTTGGAVAVQILQFPSAEVVRWDFSRGWEVAPPAQAP